MINVIKYCKIILKSRILDSISWLPCHGCSQWWADWINDAGPRAGQRCIVPTRASGALRYAQICSDSYTGWLSSSALVQTKVDMQPTMYWVYRIWPNMQMATGQSFPSRKFQGKRQAARDWMWCLCHRASVFHELARGSSEDFHIRSKKIVSPTPVTCTRLYKGGPGTSHEVDGLLWFETCL